MNTEEVIVHIQLWGSIIIAHVLLGVFILLPTFSWAMLGWAVVWLVAALVRLVTMP